MEWDIAPGDYLVEILGGRIKKLEIINKNINIDGDFFYNKLNYLNGPFVINLDKENG